MLSLLLHERMRLLLVVVPSNALREQTIRHFAILGWMKAAGVFDRAAEFSVVGVMQHGIKDASLLNSFVDGCNVVISTVAALSACSTDVRQQFATLASHLFIDEAHHLPATTWTSLRDMFKAARIVQFTATPFREDGKLVEGQVVFWYRS